jgi:phospholipid/cholesterol/gamma-HCH transport system substrate-binding protein
LEIKASYLLVGTFVLLLAAGLAGFAVWLVGADVNRSGDRYEIVFQGSVTGLQDGSPVRYRGIPVGRVEEIRIDPQNIARVLATVELKPGTPVKTDTEAILEMQGITGIAYVELVGGTNQAPVLEPEPGQEIPHIRSRPSALQQVFQSGPELLARAVEVVDRLNKLLDQQTIDAVDETLGNIETLTAALAGQSGDIDHLISGTTNAVGEVEQVAAAITKLSGRLTRLVDNIDAQVGPVGGDLVKTLADLQRAAAGLSGIVSDIRQPLSDFAGSGLYEFTQVIVETRQLIAALTRITKEFERDPAGFLLGSGTKGFEPR